MLRHYARLTPALGVAMTVASACAIAVNSSQRPDDLSGTWFDSSSATATDSTYWVLLPGGEQRNIRITVVRGVNGAPRWERQEGPAAQWWYTSGRLSDTVNRRLCFTIRPRREGGCHRFELDTVYSGFTSWRRITLFAYPMNRPHQVQRDHVLLETVPPPR